MLWLLTNDDGVDADGLQVLQSCVPKGVEYVVVAPSGPRSECGHSVTTSRPLEIQQRSERVFAVDGTPADCVRIALQVLFPEVTAVLSGINHGANLGADVYLSGTVAAAREGVFHQRPSIAISQYRHPSSTIDWARAELWLTGLLPKLLEDRSAHSGLWNINLPALPRIPEPDVVYSVVDRHPLPLRFERDGDQIVYRGDYHSRPQPVGSDVRACFSGDISVSFLRV